MTWRLAFVCPLALSLALGLAPPARAQERLGDEVRALRERLQQLEKRLSEQEAARKKAEAEKVALPPFFKDLEVAGFLSAAFNHNLADPERRKNDFHTFDGDSNQFTLHMLELALAKSPKADSPAGFSVILDVGNDAKSIHASGLGESDDPFDIQEAALIWRAPVGRGLEFKFGKFATLIGGEVIGSPHNFNFSRSFTFNFSGPFTHVGALASYPVTDQLKFTAGVVNGWDNATDNNRAKTFLGQVLFEPSPAFSLAVNGSYGAEQDDKTGPKRSLVDIVATLKPIEPLTLALNVDLGWEEDALDKQGDGRLDDVQWRAVAGIINWDITSRLSAALRGEYFLDDDGARLGFTDPDTSLPARLELVGITFSLKWNVWKNLFLRGEYRNDRSLNRRAFTTDSTRPVRSTQDIVYLEAFYTF
ncbi:MAG: porin [Nitrospinota bacterium]